MTEDHERPKSQKTITDFVFPSSSRTLSRALDEFRQQWEETTGQEVDLTRRYTSQLPREDVAWLIKHHPKRYYDGFPPFVQAYVLQNLETAASHGELDFMSGPLLKLYIQGKLAGPSDTRTR